jgi:hypothetical protein
MQVVWAKNYLLSPALLVVPTDPLHTKLVTVDTSDEAVTCLRDLLTPTQLHLHRTGLVATLTDTKPAGES